MKLTKIRSFIEFILTSDLVELLLFWWLNQFSKETSSHVEGPLMRLKAGGRVKGSRTRPEPQQDCLQQLSVAFMRKLASLAFSYATALNCLEWQILVFCVCNIPVYMKSISTESATASPWL